MDTEPNYDATVPTGMCGESKKCSRCPSDFLCWMKAKQESLIIAAREAGDPPPTFPPGWMSNPVSPAS